MADRLRDMTLASGFTATQYSKASPALDPANNKLSAPLSVLIIGASRGIGAGIAEAYAKAGAGHLLLAARQSSLDKLRAVEQRAKEVAPSSITTTCLGVDITDSASVAQLVKAVREQVSTLDVVVLNSGTTGPIGAKVDEEDPKNFQGVFNVNVMGAYHVAHHFMPLLKESEGARTFIAVGSFAAMITHENMAGTSYCISKFAQARLVEFLSGQYGEDGILSVAVHPGGVDTELAAETVPESFRAYLTDDVGLCGAFCVWLSQEKRLWLNGRLLSSKWDVDELVEKKSSIEEQDLLKFGYRVGNSVVGGREWSGMSEVVKPRKH